MEDIYSPPILQPDWSEVTSHSTNLYVQMYIQTNLLQQSHVHAQTLIKQYTNYSGKCIPLYLIKNFTCTLCIPSI